jgi:cytochrome d ubiquinol oxidase subunit I
MSASSHSVTYMVFSLVGFVLLYTIFIVVEMYLMIKAIRTGPEAHPADTPHRPGAPLPRPSAVLGGGLSGVAASHKE